MKIANIKRVVRIAPLLLLLSVCFTSQARILYVQPIATGAGDGSSWLNAFTNLQLAIDAATLGDTVFVAAGTFYPDHRHLGDSLRHSTFYVNKTIHLFGGFSGLTGTEGGFSGRDLNLYQTILSGDLGMIGNRADNAFHVMYLDHVSDTTWIDGFIIELGTATGGVGFEALGAGIYNNGDGGRSNPTIVNCIIRDNHAPEGGGGVQNSGQNGGEVSPTFINCSFISNLASGGGGLNCYADTEGETSPVLIGCKFLGNSGPTAGGGAIQFIAHSSLSEPRLINCIVTGNHSPTSAAMSCFVTGTSISNNQIINTAFSGNTGGSIRVVDLGAQTSSITIRNSIIWGNGGSQSPTTNGATIDAAFSIIPFGFPGESILGLDPMYVSQPPLLDTAHVLGDVHLLEGSPALDAGRNTDVPASITKDADNKPRFVNAANGQPGIVDIGPYEFQPNITSTAEYLPESAWNVFPSPATSDVTISFSEIIQSGQVQLMDLHGRIVATEKLNKGKDSSSFSVEGLPTGIYLICLHHNGKSAVKKISVQ